MTPDESRAADAARAKNRRTVRLTVPVEPERQPTPQERRVPVPQRQVMKDRLLRTAELVVGDLAPTLRVALLRVLIFVLVLVVLGIALGAGVALLGAALGCAIFLGARLASASD